MSMLALPVRVSAITAVVVANFVIFQIAWLCNVMNLPYWEWATVFVGLGAHLYWVSHFYGLHKLPREILWLAGMGVCGWVVEALLIRSGVLDFGSSTAVPYWLINIWLMFTTTFRFSLLPLVQRPLLLAVCAPLACLSYWGGVELNADVEFGIYPVTACLVVAAVWGLLLPVMAWIFRRYIL
jgi:hypothetical protein